MPNILSAGYAGCCEADIVADFSDTGNEPLNMTLVSGSAQTCSNNALHLTTAGSIYELDETFCTPASVTTISYEASDFEGTKLNGFRVYYDDLDEQYGVMLHPDSVGISCANDAYLNKAGETSGLGAFAFNEPFLDDAADDESLRLYITTEGERWILYRTGGGDLNNWHLSYYIGAATPVTKGRIAIGLSGTDTNVDTWILGLTKSDAHCGCGPSTEGSLAHYFTYLFQPSLMSVTLPTFSPESGCLNIDCACFSGQTFILRPRQPNLWSVAADFSCADENEGCSGGMMNPNTARYEISVAYQGYGAFLIGLIRHDGNFGTYNSNSCTAGTSNLSAMYWDATITAGADPNTWSLTGTPNTSLVPANTNPCAMQNITLAYA